jgi:hypothetical protein
MSKDERSVENDLEASGQGWNFRDFVRRYPGELCGAGTCVITGIGLSLYLLPEELGLLRRTVGGALLGALAFFVPSFGHLISGK